MTQEENEKNNISTIEYSIIDDMMEEDNTSWRTNRKIIREFCEKNLAPDWTGMRVETNFKCESVEKFVDMLMEHIEDNHYKC